MISTLVVDDDYRVAAIHAGYVERVTGFRSVGTAHTAAAAWHALHASPPDLVLLDLYLPDEHGLALMRRILSLDGPNPDIIVITAARDIRSVRTAMQLGAVHYLVKPFGFKRLAERLGAYRDLRSRLGALDEEADQDDVDTLYGLLRTAPAAGKGFSPATMRLVRDAVRGARPDISAAELAGLLGISRPTAQRYLSQLAQQGSVEILLRYGATGRPEHRYRFRLHDTSTGPVR
ncbi:MAG TPA: response regulator [Actinoplanes sp.]|jgi:response regulator of citrate/malate metabolism|nr:response regulator [Actinoplanes sp.]